MNKIFKRFLSTPTLLGLLLALSGAMLILGSDANITVAEPLQHKAPIWYADDRQSIPEPHEREPSLLWDGPKESFKRAGGRLIDPERLVRRVGTVFGGDHVPAAENVNSLDEVPNSSWFTNRLGLFPMSVEEIATGPGTGLGPSTAGKWVITRAKTEGVTPGFNIKDANGDNFLIKFDPLESPNIASAAGVISGLVLHAAGYSVPDDAVVYFSRDQLELGSDVKISMPDGSKRKMTEADIEEILVRVPR
ncbi:MAG: hypothetical protein HKN21_13320, partial [Candidatus Eisenbacteria bacterium]|nr:hypothetical protein [Candidatus Eisenbacteria bacterium]